MFTRYRQLLLFCRLARTFNRIVKHVVNAQMEDEKKNVPLLGFHQMELDDRIQKVQCNGLCVE